MSNNTTLIRVNGKSYRTLRDLLPKRPGLRALIVGKTPAPISVTAGHYFQGRQGAHFWKALVEQGILKPTTEFEDDSLLAHGYGITDVVKVPREFGNEPTDEDYKAGGSRILELIHLHQPRTVIFVYKKVLDQLLKQTIGKPIRTRYGFNQQCTGLVGARVFAVPLPGVGGCSKQDIDRAMDELAQCLSD